MLNNDLSNRMAPVLAFNFEHIICESFEKKTFRGYSYKIDQQNVHAINQLYWKEFSIYYVTFLYPGKKLDALEEELDDAGCLYNGTIRVEEANSLLYWFRQQSSGWYFDLDKNMVEALHPFGQMWNKNLVSVWQK
jgi:hypothetical protein